MKWGGGVIIVKGAAYYSTVDRPPYVWHDDSSCPAGKQIKNSDKAYGKPAGYTHRKDLQCMIDDQVRHGRVAPCLTGIKRPTALWLSAFVLSAYTGSFPFLNSLYALDVVLSTL